MRQNPAIIPTRGGFFLHDDRSADAGAPRGGVSRASGGEGEGWGGEGQEARKDEDRDALVGRWRADDVSLVDEKSRDGVRDQR